MKMQLEYLNVDKLPQNVNKIEIRKDKTDLLEQLDELKVELVDKKWNSLEDKLQDINSKEV